MIKRILLIAAGLLLSLGMQAQFFKAGPVYTLPEGDMLRLTRFQKIEYFNIIFVGDFNGRTASFTEVICADGQITSRPVYSFDLKSDTLHLTAIAQAVGGDSVRIAVSNEYGIPYADNTFRMDFAEQILMETFIPAEDIITTNSLPVIAYTRGIDISRKIGEWLFTGQDYCGLRDANIHPSQWTGKFGLKNYIYYELTVE